MAEKKPWRKWYPQDWRADVPLRMCSYAARGLWADLLTLMHESNVVGFLLVEGVAPTPKQLAGLLGGAEKEVKKLIAELGDANVFSVTGGKMPDDVKALIPDGMPEGVMLSRRMLRDEAKAAKDRANGKGGGNPKLRVNAEDDNRGVNPTPNPQSQRSEARGQRPDPREAAASESGTARAGDDDLAPPAILDGRHDEPCLTAWNEAARAEGWPEAQFLNSTRRLALRQRLGECGGADGFKAAIERAKTSDFLKDQRWFDLDWMLKSENFTRLMEGRYDQRHRENQGGADRHAPTVADGVAAAFARRSV